MKRRLVAAIAAVVLASVGAILLMNYVSSADERATAGMQATTVLVVATPIPKGTPTADLAGFVTAQNIPVNVVAPGALASLEEISGQVTTVDLQPGEQLLSSRFTDPQSVQSPSTLTIPEGMQQVTVLLEPQRVVGGNIAPGALVGVFVTVSDPPQTTLTLDKVLISNVQGGIAAAAPQAQNDAAATEPPAETPAPAPAAPAPSQSVMVTFVLAPADAQKLIHSAEHGSIWLSLEAVDGQ